MPKTISIDTDTRSVIPKDAAPRIILLLAITFLIGMYFVLRYDGKWAENDTANLTQAMRNVYQSGQLIPSQGFLYRNGYAYQVSGVFLMALTGVSPNVLQQLVLPFGIMLLAIPAWLLFYEITSSAQSALLGSMLLFTQSEFLFVVLRGSHEKFGRLFMILSLFLLFRSFKHKSRPRQLAIYIGLFYLVIFALLACNFMIGFSFVSAVAFALMGGAILEKFLFRKDEMVGTTTRRVAVIVPACLILAYLLVFYVYPPVQSNLDIFQGMFGKTRALVLGNQAATDVYSGIVGSWINPWVYALVNLSNALMLLLSFPIWAWQGVHWLLHKRKPHSRAAWLLWLLYGAFGFQAILSIISDANGFYGNLQYRLFPSFVILAIAIIMDFFSHQVHSLKDVRVAKVGLATGFFLLACLSLIKATNEASLVSYWSFYTTPELSAAEWMSSNIQNSIVWVGFNQRIFEALRQVQGKILSNSQATASIFAEPTYFLLSDLTRQQSIQMRIPLPDLQNTLEVYDNGTTQVYHRRSQTQFQP